MARLHLFEWEDQPWLPRVLRDYVTDHLQYAQTGRHLEPAHTAIAEHLAGAMRQLGERRIVDLCSGASGPLLAVRPRLATLLGGPVEVTLTDLYPNLDAFRGVSGDGVGFAAEPVDATAVPPRLTGMRTMFTALHHFRPARARAVLADAVASGAGIAIFEPLERTLRVVALTTVNGLVRGFLLTPVLPNRSLARLLATYVVPVGPFILTWDGIVSALRTYSVDELRELSRGLGEGRYDWQIDRMPMATPVGPVYWTYLIGLPKA
jgi:hypothetical protein